MYVYDVYSRKSYLLCNNAPFLLSMSHNQVVPRQQPGLEAFSYHELRSCFSGQNAARLTRSSKPLTERVVNEKLFNAPLTAVNYKDMFLHLNELEMQEHEHTLLER